MLIEVRFTEKLSDSAKVVQIHRQVGDEVSAGEPLFEVEAGKTSMPVKSTASGTLKEVKVQEGEAISPNTVLAVVEGQLQEDKSEDEADTSAAPAFDYLGSLVSRETEELESDVCIMGAGPGGYVAAIHAAKQGARTVLVERENVGGTCLNWGCIPTKALVSSARVFRTLQAAADYGCMAENVRVDLTRVMERKDNVVRNLVRGIHQLLKKNGVRLVEGEARLSGPHQVSVRGKANETIIKSESIIIATGSVPKNLPVPGMDSDKVIGSKEALQLKSLPERMVIVGGGVIGMEFAFILNSFGVKVSVVEFLDDILSLCDRDICREITRQAKKRGIDIYTGARVQEVAVGEDGNAVVMFEQKGKKRYLTGDLVLASVGRQPYLEGLGLEELGIELNDNDYGIKVNDQMQTSVPGIYAIGDVTGKVLLAHVASHQGIVAVDNIMGKEASMDYSTVPNVIFTDPEIAMVGVTEKIAREKGLAVKVGRFPFAANGKALAEGHPNGFIKLIKEKVTGKIIGGAIVGLHASDLIAEVGLAVQNGLTARQVIETIHAHPTAAEVIHEAAWATETGAIHVAK